MSNTNLLIRIPESWVVALRCNYVPGEMGACQSVEDCSQVHRRKIIYLFNFNKLLLESYTISIAPNRLEVQCCTTLICNTDFEFMAQIASKRTEIIDQLVLELRNLKFWNITFRCKVQVDPRHTIVFEKSGKAPSYLVLPFNLQKQNYVRVYKTQIWSFTRYPEKR